MPKVVELNDGVVELRPPTSADVDSLFEAVRESMAEIMPWMNWCHPGYSRVDTAEWVRTCERAWADETEFPFAICEAGSGLPLGTCGLNAVDRVNRWANLGYWVRTTATRRGIATRAAKLVADFAFTRLELDRVEILAATGNTASQGVAERVGATREGVLRQRLRTHDETQDAVVFSLIRAERR